MPSSFAVSSHIASAISTPFALQVFALPLLHTTACAIPFSTFFFVTAIGAPLTRFVVYTHATDAGTSLYIRLKSFFVLFFLIPACIPAAVKPLAAHTPFSIIFILVSFRIKAQALVLYHIQALYSCTQAHIPMLRGRDYQMPRTEVCAHHFRELLFPWCQVLTFSRQK